MRTARFFGRGDSYFCLDDPTQGPVEINCESLVASAVIYSPSQGEIGVTGVYNPTGNGCWSIGVVPASEVSSTPNWPMLYTQAGNTPVLEIEIPDDAEISLRV